MDDKEIIDIVDLDGNKVEVQLITYLVSDDGLNQYIVYTKGEVRGDANDQIIYISKLFKTEDGYKIEEIQDDNEWSEVQILLKKIANAN